MSRSQDEIDDDQDSVSEEETSTAYERRRYEESPAPPPAAAADRSTTAHRQGRATIASSFGSQPVQDFPFLHVQPGAPCGRLSPSIHPVDSLRFEGVPLPDSALTVASTSTSRWATNADLRRKLINTIDEALKLLEEDELLSN